MKNNFQMSFNEYIDFLNNENADLSQFGQHFPKSDFVKINKKQFQKLIYKNVYYRLFNILLKLFKWTVPDTLDARVMELGYILRGSICIFKDKNGVWGLPCLPQNIYNIYGNPTQVSVFGFNGYTELINVKYKTDIPTGITIQDDKLQVGEGVYSRDNDLQYPYIRYIQEYSYKISDKITALNIATQRLKSPFTFAINELDLKDTFDKLVEKIEQNDDLIIRIKQQKMSGKQLTDSFNPINTTINPSVIQAIKDSILFDFNMFLETIGINTNPSPDKSQVVLTPELNSNNSLIVLEKQLRLDNRKKLCDDVKSILGIDIQVEENFEELQQQIDDFEDDVKGEGEENGKEPKAKPKKTKSNKH